MTRKSKDDLIAHFRKRIYQRWGIDLTAEQVDQEINRDIIQAGESEPLGSTSNNRTVHKIRFLREDPFTGEEEMVEMVVIYDKGKSTVTTVLAKDFTLPDLI